MSFFHQGTKLSSPLIWAFLSFWFQQGYRELYRSQVGMLHHTIIECSIAEPDFDVLGVTIIECEGRHEWKLLYLTKGSPKGNCRVISCLYEVCCSVCYHVSMKCWVHFMHVFKGTSDFFLSSYFLYPQLNIPWSVFLFVLRLHLIKIKFERVDKENL